MSLLRVNQVAEQLKSVFCCQTDRLYMILWCLFDEFDEDDPKWDAMDEALIPWIVETEEDLLNCLKEGGGGAPQNPASS